MTPTPVLVSWSSGKDSAWTLYTLRKQPAFYDVRGIFTTVTKTFDRVSIHSTPSWILKQQALRLDLPLYEIPIPYPCTNSQYESAMRSFLDRLKELPENLAASHLAFGDLFLEDIRQYREDKLRATGFTPIFPVWGQDTTTLARRMIESGMRAIVTAINPCMIPAEFAGRWFNSKFLEDLPEEVDPLGENGEFHTCVVDGPMFSSPINAQPGRIVERKIEAESKEGNDQNSSENAAPTYVYADVVPLP